MKRTWSILMMSLALLTAVVCWAPAVLATTIYDLNIGNFTGGPMGPYGSVMVDLTTILDVDTDRPGNQTVTGAMITLASATTPIGFSGNNPPDATKFTFFGENAFGFNTAVPVTVFSSTANGADPLKSTGSGKVDGFGVFNQTFKVKDGPKSGFTTASVVIYATDPLDSFFSDASVLEPNTGSNGGHSVAGHIFWQGLNNNSTNFVTNNPAPTPIPASVLLLGSGLLGLLVLRRRKKARS